MNFVITVYSKFTPFAIIYPAPNLKDDKVQ